MFRGLGVGQGGFRVSGGLGGLGFRVQSLQRKLILVTYLTRIYSSRGPRVQALGLGVGGFDIPEKIERIQHKSLVARGQLR